MGSPEDGGRIFVNVLILHLQAPPDELRRPAVDPIGPIGRFPTLSQMTGLIANALGYTHGDAPGLQALQDRLCLASALVREGEELQDFQTVDLGQPHLCRPAWTTRSRSEHRFGGPAARYGPHIRYRCYRADASVQSAVSLSPADPELTLSAVSRAPDQPARPLMIGRKVFLPASRLVVGLLEDAESLTRAIERVPGEFPDRWREIADRFRPAAEPAAEWPLDGQEIQPGGTPVELNRVVGRWDWRNQLYGGERVVARGPLAARPPDDLEDGG